MNEPDLKTLLREAIAAAKAAQKEQAQDAYVKTIRRIGSAKKNKLEHARQLLLQVIERDERNIPAWLWLSAVVDDLEEKRICLENVLTIDPNNKPAALGFARLKQQLASTTPVSQPAKVDLVQHSPHPRATAHHDKPSQAKETVRAKSSQQKGDRPLCPSCRQSISGVATICPHCAIPLVVDCPGCDNRLDLEQHTCPHCRRKLGNFRQGIDYFADLAVAYQKNESPQKALAAWETVKVLKPDYPHIDLYLGQLQASVGRTDAAINILQQALKQEANRLAAALELGKIFQQLHQWDEAGILYRQALKLAPEEAETKFAMGWFLLEQGQVLEALPYLQQAVKLNPQHGQAWLRLAQLYDYVKNHKLAARAYRQASALLSKSSLDNLKAQQRLTALQPDLPTRIGRNSGELIRQMSGPILLCLVAALLDAGLRPWWLPVTDWLAIFLAIPGVFLWISGTDLPRNELIAQLLDEQELSSPNMRLALAIVGAVLWLLAMMLILLPIGQSLPEVPAL